MEEPSITDYEPFLTAAPASIELPGDGIDQDGDGSDPCPCDAHDHGQFVRCVARAAEQLVEEGLLTEEQKDCLVSEAAQSDCGKAGEAPPDYSDCVSGLTCP